jgi:two-component system sensor histidine kinase MtrB
VLATARSETDAAGDGGSTDAAVAIFDVTEELYPLSRSRGIKISVDAGEDTLMCMDDRAFVRALRAVLHNAVVHATSHVAVRANAGGGMARIDVIDDGPGFSNDGLIHAKERFWREDSARGRGEGSGLGLAIADELLRRYGGSMSLSNDPEGAKVTIELRLLSSQ